MNAKPILMHKELLPLIAPEGWGYVGFDEGRYLFQTGNHREGFKLMEVLEEDLTKENLALMAKLGVTRA